MERRQPVVVISIVKKDGRSRFKAKLHSDMIGPAQLKDKRFRGEKFVSLIPIAPLIGTEERKPEDQQWLDNLVTNVPSSDAGNALENIILAAMNTAIAHRLSVDIGH